MTGDGPAPGAERIVCVAANASVDRTYEVDRLSAGSIHRPLLVAARPGGKGLNAARAASAIGAGVTAVALVGGHAGAWIGEQLAALGIEAVVVETAAETRTCISILDRSTGALTEVYEPGERIEAAAWARLEAAVAAELGRGGVGALTLSGSLPPGAPADGFGRIAGLGLAAGAAVLADVHGPALAPVLELGPTIVKVNEAEAIEATATTPTDAVGRDAADRDARAAALARRLHELGARYAVVTLGDRGAVGLGPDGREHRIGPPAQLGRFPVGSGDAFLAGLAASWVRDHDLGLAMRVAAAAAAANAAVPGTGDLDPDLFRRLVAEIG